MLVDIVSKNGCMLLNVGPAADGTIPDQAQSAARHGRLAEGQRRGDLRHAALARFRRRPDARQGRRLQRAARRPFTAEDIRFTRNKDNTVLYATVMAWPGEGATLSITTLNSHAFDSGSIASISMLGVPGELTWTQDASGLRVVMPARPSGAEAYALRLTFKTPSIPTLSQVR